MWALGVTMLWMLHCLPYPEFEPEPFCIRDAVARSAEPTAAELAAEKAAVAGMRAWLTRVQRARDEGLERVLQAPGVRVRHGPEGFLTPVVALVRRMMSDNMLKRATVEQVAAEMRRVQSCFPVLGELLPDFETDDEDKTESDDEVDSKAGRSGRGGRGDRGGRAG